MTTAQITAPYALWQRFESVVGPFLRFSILRACPFFIGWLAWYLLSVHFEQVSGPDLSPFELLALIFLPGASIIGCFASFVYLGANGRDKLPAINGWIGASMLLAALLLGLFAPLKSAVPEGILHVGRDGSVRAPGEAGIRAGILRPTRAIFYLDSEQQATLKRVDRTRATRVPVHMESTVTYVVHYRKGAALNEAVLKAMREREVGGSLNNVVDRAAFRSIPAAMRRARANPERFIKRYFRSPLPYVDRIEVQGVRSKPYDPNDE